jgi:hypothetical protein
MRAGPPRSPLGGPLWPGSDREGSRNLIELLAVPGLDPLGSCVCALLAPTPDGLLKSLLN